MGLPTLTFGFEAQLFLPLFVHNIRIMSSYPFSLEEWQTCIKVLMALKEDPFNNPDNQQLKTLVTLIHKKAKKELRQASYVSKQSEDFDKLKETIIVSKAISNATLYTHEVLEEQTFTPLNLPVTCYCCGLSFDRLHFFYHKLCPSCATYNYSMRELELDFRGYQVLITGGRVKIGYATALKFLRAGAQVLVTTRFPALAWEQFSQEKDFEIWKEQLTIYGLDLRSLKAVHDFVAYCKQSLRGLDILIHNAAQTIKYPVEYYQPLMQQESKKIIQYANPKLLGNATSLASSQEQLLDLPDNGVVQLNRFGQPLDVRDKNSWNSKLEEIGLEELLEVNLINQISPYLMISELRPLMKSSIHAERFIINVTSSEGQFSYANKTVYHPHTNMTKAALNMMTRTSAEDFREDQIYMNAVDVGWISTGAHEEKRLRLFENLKIPPLDSVDGAMRIIHPILEIKKGNKALFGKLLKNYNEVNW